MGRGVKESIVCSSKQNYHWNKQFIHCYLGIMYINTIRYKLFFPTTYMFKLYIIYIYNQHRYIIYYCKLKRKRSTVHFFPGAAASVCMSVLHIIHRIPMKIPLDFLNFFSHFIFKMVDLDFPEKRKVNFGHQKLYLIINWQHFHIMSICTLDNKPLYFK